MDRDPGDFAANEPPKPVADMSEDEVTAWLSSLPPAPGIRHVDDYEAEDDLHALQDYKAGRVYDHATVSRWLRSCSGARHRRFKDWLAEQDG